MGAYTASAQDTTSTTTPPFDYKVETVKYANQNNQGTDWEYYTIRITEGTGRLYLMDYINNVQSANTFQNNQWGQNEAIQAQGIIKYGWYDASNMKVTDELSADDVHWMDVNEDNRSVGQSFNDLYNPGNQTPIVRYKYDLGTDFKEGDVIGIAMMKESGEIVGSFSANEGRNSTRYGTSQSHSADQYAAVKIGNGAWTIEAKEAMPVAEFTFGGKLNNGSTQMRYLFQGEGVTPTIQDNDDHNNGTFGSPLPGGLQFALIAGLFGLGFWYIRRRKASVA